MLVESIKNMDVSRSIFLNKVCFFQKNGMIFAERERERERETRSIIFFSKVYIQPYHCFCAMLRIFLCPPRIVALNLYLPILLR